jgi:hypothetical protein
VPLTFPTLSRKPALKTRGQTLDPTLRDSYENGMEATRARWTRRRRQWDISIDLLTPDDMSALENFVEAVQYGALNFLFADPRFPTEQHTTYNVRFSTLPSYSDAGSVEGEFRQNCTFSIREM